MRVIIFISFCTILTAHCNGQSKDTSLIKNELYDDDTVMLRDSFYKFYLSFDYNYSPLKTNYGDISLTGGGFTKDLISFSAGAGLWYRYGKRMGLDLNAEVGYKQLCSDTVHFIHNPANPAVQIVKGIYAAERYFISFPIGITYQYGKRWRFGISSFLVPKFNVFGTLHADEYFSDGNAYGTDRSGMVRPNLEFRFAPVIEIPVGSSKIKLYPQYRTNLFIESKKSTETRSGTMAFCLEFML